MLEKGVWWRTNRAQQAELQQSKQAPSGGEVAYDYASCGCGCVSKLMRQGNGGSGESGTVAAGAMGGWSVGGEGRAQRGALCSLRRGGG
jgi:hypothetical protein